MRACGWCPKKAMVLINTADVPCPNRTVDAVARSRSRTFGASSSSSIAKRLLGIVFVLVILVLAGGAAFLATWDIPAPTAAVEKVIPDDRFPR